MAAKRLAEYSFAFLDGYNAAFDTPHMKNPYGKETGEHDSWRLGYRAAQEEMEGRDAENEEFTRREGG